MARGGHNAKPIALHQAQGTFRKDRHAAGAAIEDRIRALPPALACDFCGETMAEDFPLMTSMNDTGLICANCVAGAVFFFTKEGYDFKPFMNPKADTLPELWNGRG